MDYFRGLIAAIAPNRAALDSRLARLCEIPPPELLGGVSAEPKPDERSAIASALGPEPRSPVGLIQ